MSFGGRCGWGDCTRRVTGCTPAGFTPVDPIKDSPQLLAASRVDRRDVSDPPGEVTPEVVMVVAILIPWTVPGTIGQHRFEPVERRAKDIQPIVHHHTGDVLVVGYAWRTPPEA